MDTVATQSDLEHAYSLLYSGMDLCGCGNPEDAYMLIRDVLALAPFYEHPEAVRDLIGHPGADHVVLSAMDAAELIEHGTGIGGSWITPKGTLLLRVLREICLTADWGRLENIALPHDGADCVAACWEA